MFRSSLSERYTHACNSSCSNAFIIYTSSLPILLPLQVLFGAAVFVLADDSSSATDQPLTSDVARRGASQFSVALLTKAPAMELLLNRLRRFVEKWFTIWPTAYRASSHWDYSGAKCCTTATSYPCQLISSV
jgi:hypothetical protein